MLKSSINIGNFDFRLVIEANTYSVNATTNERESSWSVLTTVWAKRVVNGGTERFEGDQLVARNSEIYLIRYSNNLANLDSTHRIYESGTTDYYYITLVEKQKREGWIRLIANIRDE